MRSFCKLESFFSSKGLRQWCCKLSVLLQIPGAKVACYEHYVTDITFDILRQVHEMKQFCGQCAMAAFAGSTGINELS